MKTLTTALIALLISLTSLGQVTNESVVTEVDPPENKEGSVTMVYESYAFQLKALEEQRDNNLWNDAIFEKKKARIPAAGTLNFVIRNKDKKIAQPARHKIVVSNGDGSTLYSNMMKEAEPEKVKGMWEANKKVLMKEGAASGTIKVMISNTITKIKYTWTVAVK